MAVSIIPGLPVSMTGQAGQNLPEYLLGYPF